MAFEVSIKDLATGDVETFQVDQVERTWETGTRRVDPDGAGDAPPQLIETGARRLLVKAFAGEALGMKSFEDFTNFTDDVPDEGDEPAFGLFEQEQ